MIFVVIIGAVLGARVIATTADATSRLIDHSLPAQREALQFQSTLLDQETGVRGYAITGDPQFLQPYQDGLTTEQESADRMRKLLGHEGGRVNLDIDDIERAARQWRSTYVAPLLASPATARAQGDATAAEGKQMFDNLRSLFTQQNQNLADAVTRDTDRLNHDRAVRDSILIGLLVVYLLTGVGLAVLVRRLIDRPLKYLTESSRRVAGGDFGFRIDVHGPADVAAVATAVDDMRRRIVAELDSSRVQQAQLHEQKLFLDAQTVELRRSNAELEQFAYVASHDLQEPLRKVAAFCQLLEKRYAGQLDERATQYIDFAVDGAKRMQILINDLLTFSRVGRVTDGSTELNLAQPLDRALANLAAAIEDSDAQITRPEQLPQLMGEPILLTMLWQNLIGNAIKFRAPDRTPRILITCEPDDAGWLLSVQDNGIGIRPEFAEKVFIIFQRLHNRTEYDGTGIGLALTKKIVEHHGGRIWLDTDYTGGTRICFTLTGAPAAVDVLAADTDIRSEGIRP
ncbi:CHASE3 domain-containing protein [Nocardia sp. NPDC088792]|uniref:sensor histidine kinase n=1 Tax=Nocardia sp. NPDC088792 TaxID=3364332 RepID=UPI0037FD4EF2